MLEDQRQTGPIWLAAGDVRPDAGLRAQISAGTAIVDQSTRLQVSSRRGTVAERLVSGLSCIRGGQGGRSSGESRLKVPLTTRLNAMAVHQAGNPAAPQVLALGAQGGMHAGTAVAAATGGMNMTDVIKQSPVGHGGRRQPAAERACQRAHTALDDTAGHAGRLFPCRTVKAISDGGFLRSCHSVQGKT